MEPWEHPLLHLSETVKEHMQKGVEDARKRQSRNEIAMEIIKAKAAEGGLNAADLVSNAYNFAEEIVKEIEKRK